MPYFRWRGVALDGAIKRGTSFAHSHQDLDASLFRQDIALMQSQLVRSKNIRFRSITLEQKLHFFRQLSHLLNAGILLPQALLLVSEHIYDTRLQEIIAVSAQRVQEGISFHQTLAPYPKLFDQFVLHMVHIGQESGTLAICLTLLSQHLEMIQDLHKKIKSALIMPIITFLFFILVAITIIVVVLPRFAHIFNFFQKELPPLTRGLLALGIFLQQWALYLMGAIIGCIVVGRYIKKQYASVYIDRMLLHLPLIGTVVRSTNALYFCRSIALLLRGGFSLPKALSVAQVSLVNKALAQEFLPVADQVASGTSFTDILHGGRLYLFSQDMLAIIKIGEDSGNLANMLDHVAAMYKEQTMQRLNLLITLIQPLCVLLLGFLIMMLMLALYMPIVQMGTMIA